MKIGWILVSVLSIAMPATARTVTTTPELIEAIGTARSGDRIVVADRTYFLEQPLAIGVEQSGVIIAAADGATPIISGGVRISGWRAAKLNGHDCWAADVPAVLREKIFRSLWVNGHRAVRARTPDAGSYFKVVQSPDADDQWEHGVARIDFKGNDIPAGPYPPGAEVVAMCRWIESRLPLKSVDADKHVATFWRKSKFRLEPGDPYWIEGDARSFDQPGEWYLDHEKGVVYYLPLAGETIEKCDAIAPRLSQLLKIAGSTADKKFVENLTIRGITFSHTEWMLPEVEPATTKPSASGFGQAAAGVPAAIDAVALRASTFDHCTVEHIGNYAMDFGAGCSHDTVSHCTMRDLGAGGIKLGEPRISHKDPELNFANQIIDNEICDGGHVFPSAVGILVWQSFDNLIAHNHVHDLFYTGISTGWSWGYGESLNRGNIVEKNLVHHIGKKSNGDGPILSDMGGVYLLGARNGSIVRNNIFHDIAGIKYGGWGIYLDEGSSNVLVENNLVYRTSHEGFHLHYGANNTVANNIFAFGGRWQIQRSLEEDHLGFTFEHNIVYWLKGPLTNSSPVNVKFDYNLYGPIAASEIRAGNLTFEQWQKSGQDVHSVVADPGFGDPTNGRFDLKNIDAAKTIGFVPLDVSDVGVRPLRP